MQHFKEVGILFSTYVFVDIVGLRMEQGGRGVGGLHSFASNSSLDRPGVHAAQRRRGPWCVAHRTKH